MILDTDLAKLYGVQTKRLNEQIKRNSPRFGSKYLFKLTQEEFIDLRSHFATSKKEWGGRRYPPWAFTEYGVVMAATVLDSETAIEASKFIVDVFVEVRRGTEKRPENALLPLKRKSRLVRTSPGFGEVMFSRLQSALDLVLDSVIDTRRNTIVREEAQILISESIQHIKERLKKQGLENDEISARITKHLAEAEKEKALAAKTRAEAEAFEFATIVKKLRLLLEVQRAIEFDRLEDFLKVLKDFN